MLQGPTVSRRPLRTGGGDSQGLQHGGNGVSPTHRHRATSETRPPRENETTQSHSGPLALPRPSPHALPPPACPSAARHRVWLPGQGHRHRRWEQGMGHGGGDAGWRGLGRRGGHGSDVEGLRGGPGSAHGSTPPSHSPVHSHRPTAVPYHSLVSDGGKGKWPAAVSLVREASTTSDEKKRHHPTRQSSKSQPFAYRAVGEPHRLWEWGVGARVGSVPLYAPCNYWIPVFHVSTKEGGGASRGAGRCAGGLLLRPVAAALRFCLEPWVSPRG